MNRKKISPKNPTKKIHREREPIPLRYCLLTLTCGLILIVGFFFAARQHFSSIDFGIKNSRLKKQIEELETDKRRLILAKEIALTPSEIKKAAKKIGLFDMTASNIEVSRLTNQIQEKPKVETPKVEISEITKPKQAFSSKPEDVKPAEKKKEKDVRKSPEVKEVKGENDKTSVKTAKK